MRYGTQRRRTHLQKPHRRIARFETLELRRVLAASLSEAPADPPIAFYFLADVDTDETITEVTPGATIDPALVAGREVTVYALANFDESSGAAIESAVVSLDAGSSNRENVTPYALFGDTNGDFKKGVDLSEGPHVFRAVFYSGDNASGTLLEDVSLQFTVASGPANQPPVAGDDGFETNEDTSAVFDVLSNDTDPEGDVIAVQSVGAAANGVTSVNSLGEVVYSPNLDFFGSDSFRYTISDTNGGTDTATVTVDVTPVNDAPVATDDTIETLEDTAASIDVLSNDTDVDDPTLAILSASAPSNGSALISGGAIIYTPDGGFVGQDRFEYTIVDAAGETATGTVRVNVTSASVDTLARYFIADVDTDETLAEIESGDVLDPSLVNGRQVTLYALANTDDAAGARIASAVVSLDGGVSNTENVSPYALFGDSNGDFNSGVSLGEGAHVFRAIFFAGANGGGELLADVSVDFTVGPTQPNRPPDAVDDSVTTDEDVAVSIDVVLNDTDPDGDTLTVQSVGETSSGGVVIQEDGTLLYTPNLNFFGTDSFTYTVSDGEGATDSATVSIQIDAVNDPPDVGDLEFTILEDSGTFALTVSADQFGTDVESETIYFFDVTGEVGGEVTLAGEASILFYSPDSNFSGTERLTVRLWDQMDAGSLGTATLTINVSPVNDAPEAIEDVAETPINEPVLVDVIANDIDVDGDELVVTSAGTPLTGTVSITTDGILYTPGIDFVGVENFSYTIADPSGETSSANVEVTVNEQTSVGVVSGELKKWHKVTVDFPGPFVSETDATNPFLDYRLDVTFTHLDTGEQTTVPGFFAADGDAANTSATSGNVWRVHFAPDQVGAWTYSASFRAGAGVAANDNPLAGTGIAFDGDIGNFQIGETDKSGRDLRGKGQLRYVGERYLQFAETGEYFLKQGPDSPENLLAYEDFDNTTNVGGRLKNWAPHQQDYRPGDPSWQDGKGTELIGAINYLASEGMNAYSFIPMTYQGDDENVFPWISKNSSDRTRFDVSKLSQWEIVFEHGDEMGMFQHFKTQETENELLLDDGDLGTERKLYYRELIARFSHHLALNWNLGEEINNASTAQKQAWAQYFRETDPYDHHIVIHNGANHYDLLGDNSELTGFSLQTNRSDFANVHDRVKNYLDRSEAAGKIWAVAVDEPGDAQAALRPDSNPGNAQVDARKNALWGTLLAGGWGNEWYFGYQYENSDLTLQDFRSRDQWWDTARYALEFFEKTDLPFWEMVNANEVSSASADFGFIKADEYYVVYLKDGGTTDLDLREASGEFSVTWYDPRNGGELQDGNVTTVTGGDWVNLGVAPNQINQDWVILVQSGNINNAPVVSSPIADLSVAENSADLTIDLSSVFSDVEDSSLSYAGSVVDSSIVAMSIDQSIATLAFSTDTIGQTLITITATDSGGKSVSDEFQVTLGDFNAPPTDLILDNSNVDENSPGETLVGVLTVVDPDDTTHSFRLLNDAQGRFSVTSLGEIEVANGELLDYESATSHDIIVEVSDGTNEYVELFTIAVNNLNDGPAEPGLFGSYFNSISLTSLASERIDPTVNFPVDALGDDAQGQVASDDNYSIRWEGFVLTPENGSWQFTTYSNDGVRLWVGDVGSDADPIIDHWDQHKSTRDDATINLGSGWHPIRLEYFQQNGTSDIRLLFSGPGQSEIVIPSSNLSTGEGEQGSSGSQLFSAGPETGQGKNDEETFGDFKPWALDDTTTAKPRTRLPLSIDVTGSTTSDSRRDSRPLLPSATGLDVLSDAEIEDLFDSLV